MVIFTSISDAEWEERYKDIRQRVARENAVHIHIWKQNNFTVLRGGEMWEGKCTCGKTWKFWFFGATLGYGLEHIRREIAGSL